MSMVRGGLWAAFAFGVVASAQAQQVRNVVYRCPGNPVLYTDAISEKEAKERGCRTIEGAPITIIQTTPPTRRAATPVPSTASPSATSRPEPSARVEPSEQRARDTDRRAILAAELRRDEQVLAEMQREYNNGEPERQGNERNYQKYLDRVAEMKMAIARKENDIAALKRELAKLPQ
ncbi:hypothetical protein [Piscinibacter sakaiensis]|uniref:hypothetical protein n=1 Tax=Piscinibacter sakaiensis TaxID=1547922 RepID=UPI003AAC492F